MVSLAACQLRTFDGTIFKKWGSEKLGADHPPFPLPLAGAATSGDTALVLLQAENAELRHALWEATGSGSQGAQTAAPTRLTAASAGSDVRSRDAGMR